MKRQLLLFASHMETISRGIKEGKAIGIVGIYGSGKVLLADEIERVCRENNDVVIRISLKELPTPTSYDIYHVFQKAIQRAFPVMPTPSIDSDFSFHYYLQEVVRTVSNAHCIFLIEEAQTLIPMPESFFDALESLRYRNLPNVSIILLGQPQLRSRSNAGLTRVIQDVFLYMQPITHREMDVIVPHEERRLSLSLHQWKSSIYSLSGGHYGTIKYINQLIKKHGRLSKRLTTSKILAWAQKEALFQFFLRIVWDSINDDERLILTELLETNDIRPEGRKTRAFEECLKLGLIHMRGNKLSFIVPMYRDTVRVLVARKSHVYEQTPATPLIIKEGVISIHGNSADSLFTYQERRVLSELIIQKGSTVSYDTIGLLLWGSNVHRFSLENIAQVIRRIRKKLSSVGIAPKTIRTISTAGYMLVG